MSDQDRSQDHQHDLVRVEDEQHGLAWNKCRTCPHRSEPEPWAPLRGEALQEFLDDFNTRRAADAQLAALAERGQEGGA